MAHPRCFFCSIRCDPVSLWRITCGFLLVIVSNDYDGFNIVSFGATGVFHV